MNTKALQKRVNQLYKNSQEDIVIGVGIVNDQLIENVYSGTISLLKILYDSEYSLFKDLLSIRNKYTHSDRAYYLAKDLMTTLQAILETMKFEIKNGFINNLQTQITVEIIGDFINLAKELKDSNYKESSAVLACAALEDTLKKFAMQKGLDVYDKELTVVINSLKSQGLLKSVQIDVLNSFVKVRNKAFHAQFDKISMPEIVSIIAFVEQFLIQEYQ